MNSDEDDPLKEVQTFIGGPKASALSDEDETKKDKDKKKKKKKRHGHSPSLSMESNSPPAPAPPEPASATHDTHSSSHREQRKASNSLKRGFNRDEMAPFAVDPAPTHQPAPLSPRSRANVSRNAHSVLTRPADRAPSALDAVLPPSQNALLHPPHGAQRRVSRDRGHKRTVSSGIDSDVSRASADDVRKWREQVKAYEAMVNRSLYGGAFVKVRSMRGHTGAVYCLEPLGDSLLLSGGQDGTIRVWDVARGVQIAAMKDAHRDTQNQVWALAQWAPGVVVSGANDGGLRVWMVRKPEKRKSSAPAIGPGGAKAPQSPRGNRVFGESATPSNRYPDLHDVILKRVREPARAPLYAQGGGEWELLKVLKGHEDIVLCLERMGKSRMASGSRDKTVRVWNTRGQTVFRLEGHTNAVWTLRKLPKSGLASGSYDSTIRFWNVRTGDCTRVIQTKLNYIFALVRMPHEGHPDPYLVCSSFQAAASGTGAGDRAHGAGGGNAATVKQGGAAYDGVLQVWDTGTGGQVKTMRGHSDWVHALRDLDDTTLISGGMDGTVMVWDVRTGECLRTHRAHKEAIMDIVQLPKRTLATSSASSTIRVWQIESGILQETARLILPKLLVLYRRLNEKERLARTAVQLASIFAEGGHDDDAESVLLAHSDLDDEGVWAALAAAQARLPGHEAELVSTRLQLARHYRRRGALQESLAACNDALEAARKMGALDVEAAALEGLKETWKMLQSPRKAGQYAQELARLYERNEQWSANDKLLSTYEDMVSGDHTNSDALRTLVLSLARQYREVHAELEGVKKELETVKVQGVKVERRCQGLEARLGDVEEGRGGEGR